MCTLHGVYPELPGGSHRIQGYHRGQKEIPARGLPAGSQLEIKEIVKSESEDNRSRRLICTDMKLIAIHLR